jgi:hypothetical protein
MHELRDTGAGHQDDVLLGMFVAFAMGPQVVAATVGTRSEDPLVVAATTLGVGGLFNPLRVRIQKLVDRRFNRSRYDAERVMDGFARSLRDVIDPVAVVDGWTGVVADTMEPTMVGVWVSDKS